MHLFPASDEGLERESWSQVSAGQEERENWCVGQGWGGMGGRAGKLGVREGWAGFHSAAGVLWLGEKKPAVRSHRP